MTGGMKSYLVLGALVLGLHGIGAMSGWWKGFSLGNIVDSRGGGGSGGSTGFHSSGGFRGGK